MAANTFEPSPWLYHEGDDYVGLDEEGSQDDWLCTKGVKKYFKGISENDQVRVHMLRHWKKNSLKVTKPDYSESQAWSP